jgi:hypothetical protein
MGILWHSEEHFSTLGLAMIGRDQKDVIGPVSFENEARFKAVFGTSAWMCLLIWRMLDEQTDYLNNRHAQAKHLLWGLVIIKVYGNEKAMCAIVANPKAPSEKTYQKWAWYFVKAIPSLEGYVVSI